MGDVMRSAILSAAFLVAVVPCQAAWITFQNDTKGTIIIQEMVTVKGKVTLGKPVKLQPGETFREFQPGPLTKKIQVSEPGKTANKVLCEDEVAVKDKDVTFSIATVKDKVKVLPVEPKKK